MKRYDPKTIEPKWQKAWYADNLYQAIDFDEKRPKYVMLTEFPYPSGEGLHMGHAREYTLGDIIARRKRMGGFNVLYPMGYDSFGLPTENYAIKNKIAPQIVAKQNIKNFQKQFESLGVSVDWSRSFSTADPDYYKWTQWLFLQFYKAGLAYRDEVAINWCPKCKTGLANEEVVGGVHERCDTLVQKKQLKQWVLKITDYADKLIDGLETVDYPSNIADQQINWIGRSQGAEIEFNVNEDNNYVLLHGYTGSASANFFPELVKEIKKAGRFVYAPDLPNTNNPDIDEQVNFVLKNAKFDENTVIFGHSLGGVVALKVIEKLHKPIKKVVLAATFAQPKFLDHQRPFESKFNWEFDYKKIKANVSDVVILRAQNDTAVPQERSDFIQKQIGGRIIDFLAEEDHICGAKEPVVVKTLLPSITVFTTRPDTIFGATYMVLAPEHPLVSEITTKEQQKAVDDYVCASLAKSDIDRQADAKNKTGVFTGAYSVNPANGKNIPIWIADYVLMGYGTGAIMAVPAHDERDFAFAKTLNLPITQVVYPVLTDTTNPPRDDKENTNRFAVMCVIRHPEEDKFLTLKWKKLPWHNLVTGGIEKGEDLIECAKREIIEETGYKNPEFVRQMPISINSRFYATHKDVNRDVVFTIFEFKLKNLELQDRKLEEHEDFDVVWSTKDELIDLKPIIELPYILRWLNEGDFAYPGEGRITNSGEYDGLDSSEMREKIVADLAKKGVAREKIQYKLRDWIFSRQHYWGEPIPIIHCEKCGLVPVPEEQLPVTLPLVEHYEPTDNGESPLSKVKDWVNTTCPICSSPAKRETDTMPNWAGSSWYYLRYYDAKNPKEFAAKDKLEYWGQADLYLGGMEHTTLHLLYSRFWHKFLFDQGLVSTAEPYKARRGQGIILAADGNKMSKSKGNVVNPIDIVEQGYGADALRLAIAFIAPYDQTTAWKPEIVPGLHRFISRVWVLTLKYIDTEKSNDSEDIGGQILVATHSAIKKVSQDLEQLNFNTAISALMEFTNTLYLIEAKQGFTQAEHWEFAILSLLKLLAPFAPHLTEELWQQLDQKGSIHLAQWPVHDDAYLVQNEVNIAIQVNGKLRGEIKMPFNSEQSAVEEAAKEHENAAQYLSNEIKKVIYIPNKLISFVI